MIARLLLIIILGSTAVDQAPAQRTGSRIGRDATARDGAKALEIVAECVTGWRPNFVSQWLEILPGTLEESALLKKEADNLGSCMDSDKLVLDGKEVVFKPRMLRRPVASAMVARALIRAPARSPLPRDSEPWFMPKLAAMPADGTVDRAQLVLQDFGHCVAVNQWTGTLALLAAKPDSSEQAGAIKMLMPVLGPCLTEGANITLTPANLRIVLAEPVYHLLKLAASPAPAGDR